MFFVNLCSDTGADFDTSSSSSSESALSGSTDCYGKKQCDKWRKEEKMGSLSLGKGKKGAKGLGMKEADYKLVFQWCDDIYNFYSTGGAKGRSWEMIPLREQSKLEGKMGRAFSTLERRLEKFDMRCKLASDEHRYQGERCEDNRWLAPLPKVPQAKLLGLRNPPPEPVKEEPKEPEPKFPLNWGPPSKESDGVIPDHINEGCQPWLGKDDLTIHWDGDKNGSVGKYGRSGQTQPEYRYENSSLQSQSGPEPKAPWQAYKK